MSRSRKSAVRKYHDRVAPRYDDSYGDAYWQWHDTLTWQYLKPFLPKDMSAAVLDLGCGTGKWGAKLAKSGYAVTSVDISPRMLDQARLKIEAQSSSRESSFIHADLCDLSALETGHYALAVAFGDPIGCSQSPPKAMKQIRRALTRDGILVATFDNRLAAIDYYLSKGDPDLLQRFLRDGKTHWLTKDADERFPIHTFTPGDVVTLVEKSGFELLDMVGKTVLPMRHYRELLETPEARRTWARIERRLARKPAGMGRASHLQIACRAVKKGRR